MSDPMRIRPSMQGDKVLVRMQISHEMETGQRKDSTGKTVPAWFIQNVVAVCNGKTIMRAQFGPSVSKNPFVSFTFKGAKSGDKVAVTWVDNKGEKRTDEAAIA